MLNPPDQSGQQQELYNPKKNSKTVPKAVHSSKKAVPNPNPTHPTGHTNLAAQHEEV